MMDNNAVRTKMEFHVFLDIRGKKFQANHAVRYDKDSQRCGDEIVIADSSGHEIFRYQTEAQSTSQVFFVPIGHSQIFVVKVNHHYGDDGNGHTYYQFFDYQGQLILGQNGNINAILPVEIKNSGTGLLVGPYLGNWGAIYEDQWGRITFSGYKIPENGLYSRSQQFLNPSSLCNPQQRFLFDLSSVA